MIDFPLPHEPLGDPERKGRMSTDQSRRQACKDAVTALRRWQKATAEEDEADAMFAMRQAVARMDILYADGTPPDTTALLGLEDRPGITCPRWHSGPVEPCAAFRGHRGPCLRERDIVKGREMSE